MKKKLLSVVLALAMVLSLMPMAWAEGTETAAELPSPVVDKAVTLTQGKTVLQQYDTLQAALDAVKAYHYKNNKDMYTLTLNQNLTENVEIPAKPLNLTIDLNGHKLQNNGNHTIVNKSTYNFKITDSKGGGTVDNLTHGKAAIYNDVNAQIILSGGTYMRSNEASTSDSNSSGNSFYVIKNFGSMTINSGVTVKFSDKNQGLYSSLIGNGWQDAAAAEAGTNGEPRPSISKRKATLAINEGVFIGGQITVKNDDYGTLTIKNGTFTQSGEGRSVVANNHVATISGGTFMSASGPAVYSRRYAGEANNGTLTISGGTFTSTGSHAVALLTSGAKAVISGGTFTPGTGSYGVHGVGGTTAQISGGTFKAAGEEKICDLQNAFVPPYGAVQDENGNFTIQVTDGEAVVIENGVTTQYPTLKAAMRAVKTGGTVQLRRDVALETGVKTDDVSGITLDLNGHSIDGTVVKSADGVVCMKAAYGWKPQVGIDPTMKIVNSVSGQGGEIKGKLPVQFASGNSKYEIPGIIGEGVTLVVTGEGTDAVKLGTSAYLVYSETTKGYIKNGGFKVTVDDGTERIYGSYTDAVKKAADSVVTMLHDYTGNECIYSGSLTGTLDLSGHTFTYLKSDKIVDINYDNAGITIRNGTLTSTASALSQGGVTALYNNTTLVLEHVTMNVPGDSYGIVTNGTNTGNTVTLKNSTLNATDGLGIYFPSTGSVTIENSKINAKHFGVQVCAGSLNIIGDQTAVTATGAKQQKTNGDGPIIDGAAISVVEREGYKDLGEVSIQGGAFKSTQVDAVKAYAFNNANKEEELWGEANTVVKITGGHFTSDPTAYLAEGKAVLPGTEPGYAFTVGDKAVTEIVVEPATGDPVVDMSAIPPESKDAAEAVAKSVEDNGELAAAANSVLDTVTAEEKAAAEKELKDTLHTGEAAITTYVQTYLDIKPTAYDAGNKTFTLDITPMYRVVASTAANAEDIEVVGETSGTANAVVLKGSEAELTTLKTMTISVTLPDAWQEAYVQHKGHEYVATVKDKVAIFTNPHGFSEFVISAAPAAVAEVNGERYMNLTDALNAAKDKDTVIILKAPDVNTNFTMSGDSREITVQNGTGSDLTITINGEKHENVKNGESFQVKYTRPSSGGSSSSSYTVNVEDSKNGTVTASHKSASKNTTVTLTVKADKGYELDELTVTDKNGKELKLTDKGNGKYTFAMPASKVDVKATFAEIVEKPAYSDVSASAWYAKAVAYVTEKGVMEGDSGKFMPLDKLTRSQMAQVLFNLEGKKSVNYALTFGDMNGTEWYAEAVRWAASEQIVNGYDNGNFGPNDPLTREQLAAIMYRYTVHKGYVVTASGALTAYNDGADTSSWAKSAVEWAVGAGLLSGKDGNRLDPQGAATRAEVAQILMNFDQKF